MAWTKPTLIEVACGMEINMYGPAEEGFGPTDEGNSPFPFF